MKTTWFENLFVPFIYFKFVVFGGIRGRAVLPDHSLARVNLNKSEKFLTNTTAASKYIPRGVTGGGQGAMR